MDDIKELPAFASEAEEAAWWYEHREEHAERFVKAFAEGRVTRGRMAARLMNARAVALGELSEDDQSKARLLAEKRGMEVQGYLSLLVHEALEREARIALSTG